MLDADDDIVTLDAYDSETAATEIRPSGYKYAQVQDTILTSDPKTRDDEKTRVASLLGKIHEATKPDKPLTRMIKEETAQYRYRDLLAYSAASGVDFFKLAPLSYQLRNKYYFTPVVVSESVMSEKEQSVPGIRPKGFMVKTKHGNVEESYRIGALFNMPYKRFALQIGAAVQNIPSLGEKPTKNSVQLMMLSPNFLRLIEEYDREAGHGKGQRIIQLLQKGWGYQTHDHIHALIRDFDDAPPDAFKRYDFGVHHARHMGADEVIEARGPFPVGVPTNEYWSQLMVLEGWKIKFLADAQKINLNPDPTGDAHKRHEHIKKLGKWVEHHREEIRNFDWSTVQKGKLYTSILSEINEYDQNVREFATWAKRKHNDPSIQSEIEGFCYLSYLHLMLNVLPENTPAIQDILNRNPEIRNHPQMDFFRSMHDFKGKLQEGSKIADKDDTTSVWTFVRAYADGMSKYAGTNLSVDKSLRGIDHEVDFHKAHSELFDMHETILAEDLPVANRAQIVTEALKGKTHLYQHVYNSTIYTLHNSILADTEIRKNHANQLRAIFDVADTLSGNAAPTYQEMVDIWHLENMLSNHKAPVADQWQIVKAREFTRYVLGKDQISESVCNAVKEVLMEHGRSCVAGDTATKGIAEVAKEQGLNWKRSDSDTTSELTSGEKQRLKQVSDLLDAKPDTKINGAEIVVRPGRVAELRVQVG